MKAKLCLLFFLLQPVLLQASKPAFSPAAYTVTVHIVFSRGRQLETIIDGVPVNLTQYSSDPDWLLRPGDYKARLIANLFAPKNPPGFYVFEGYELLLPDGSARSYAVSGIGLKGGGIPAIEPAP